MSLEGLVKNFKSQYLAQTAFELCFVGMLMDTLYKYKAGRGLVRLWSLGICPLDEFRIELEIKLKGSYLQGSQVLEFSKSGAKHEHDRSRHTI